MYKTLKSFYRNKRIQNRGKSIDMKQFTRNTIKTLCLGIILGTSVLSMAQTTGKENEKLEKYIKKAEQLKEELSKDGIEASVITEEPFVGVKDSIEFKVYLMIWKKGVLNRKVELRRIV